MEEDDDRSFSFNLTISFDESKIGEISTRALALVNIAVLLETANKLIGQYASEQPIESSWWQGTVKIGEQLVSYRWDAAD